MTTWKVIRIYQIRAETKKAAMEAFVTAYRAGNEDEFLTSVFVKDDSQPTGLWATVKRQVLG